jgi:glycine C-acetyltransferase
MMGESAMAQRFSARLFEEGVFAQSVVYPTVPLDKARIRTIVTAEHTTEQLDRCLAAFGKVGRDLGLIAG